MLKNVQCLRGVAAYMVVLYHFLQQASEGYAFDAPVFLMSGVDIFFVISGFIMVFTNYNSKRTVTDFWRNRVIRIVPLYWFATILIAVTVKIGFSPLGIEEVGAAELLSSLFFIPNTDSNGIMAMPLLDVGWTLNYEMFFYFCFGLYFLNRNMTNCISILMAMFIFFILLGNIKMFDGNTSGLAQFLSHPILLEFIFGAGVAIVFLKMRERGMRLSSSLAFALFAIGIAALLSSEFINFDIHNYRVIFYGVPAVAILLGALLLEQNGWMTTSRFILLQGAASYSIYLFHVLALQASAKGFSIIAPGSGLKVELLTSVLAAGIAGTMIHLMLEKPMTSFWKRSERRVVRV